MSRQTVADQAKHSAMLAAYLMMGQPLSSGTSVF